MMLSSTLATQAAEWTDALNGMTLEEEGYYVRLTRLLVRTSDGFLDDDDRRNAFLMNVPIRVYRRLKERLLGWHRPLLKAEAGRLTSLHAEREIEYYLATRKRASERGRQSIEHRWSILGLGSETGVSRKFRAKLEEIINEINEPLIRTYRDQPEIENTDLVRNQELQNAKFGRNSDRISNKINDPSIRTYSGLIQPNKSENGARIHFPEESSLDSLQDSNPPSPLKGGRAKRGHVLEHESEAEFSPSLGAPNQGFARVVAHDFPEPAPVLKPDPFRPGRGGMILSPVEARAATEVFWSGEQIEVAGAFRVEIETLLGVDAPDLSLVLTEVSGRIGPSVRGSMLRNKVRGEVARIVRLRRDQSKARAARLSAAPAPRKLAIDALPPTTDETEMRRRFGLYQQERPDSMRGVDPEKAYAAFRTVMLKRAKESAHV